MTAVEDFAGLRSGKQDDIGLWLAERLQTRYAYDSEAYRAARGAATQGVWKWRLSSGRLSQVDASVVVQAVRCELDHVYYAVLDDSTFTAAAVERLSSDTFIERAVMPVLRMLLALPVASKPRSKPKSKSKPPTPEEAERRRAAAASLMRRRRRCAECLMESTIAGIGNHQKTTGHVGHIDVAPSAVAPKRKARRANPGYHTEDGRASISAASTRTASLRRRCDECGLVTGNGPLGSHQKATGHSGWTDVEPTPDPIESTESPS